MKGSGRAFCAGGDIVSLYHMINAGKMEDCKEFFRTLYTYIYILGTCLKPHVFATPETLIGFHPDAGVSFFLSHLPGQLGEYLGLTVEKLNGAEMISCGLATHYAHSSKLALIEEQLGKLDTDDPSVIENSLEKYSDLVCLDNISVLHRIEILDKCFSHDTVEEIIDSLGVRARMIDKDLAPKWNPPRLEQVSKDIVEHYFSPLSKSEPDLELPTEEAFT
ncbi:hypothetical protein ACB092_11G165900 [Castanea dentata]